MNRIKTIKIFLLILLFIFLFLDILNQVELSKNQKIGIYGVLIIIIVHNSFLSKKQNK